MVRNVLYVCVDSFNQFPALPQQLVVTFIHRPHLGNDLLDVGHQPDLKVSPILIKKMFVTQCVKRLDKHLKSAANSRYSSVCSFDKIAFLIAEFVFEMPFKVGDVLHDINSICGGLPIDRLTVEKITRKFVYVRSQRTNARYMKRVKKLNYGCDIYYYVALYCECGTFHFGKRL